MQYYQRLIKLQLRLQLLCRQGAADEITRGVSRDALPPLTPRLITCCLHANSLINWAVTFKQLPLRLVLIELSNAHQKVYGMRLLIVCGNERTGDWDDQFTFCDFSRQPSCGAVRSSVFLCSAHALA